MQRVSDIVGKPIISAESGEKLGKVSDVLVDREGSRVVGVVMRKGLLASERVLPYGDVQALGDDAVVARSERGVIGPQEWNDRGVESARSSTLLDKRVLTSGGHRIGAVKDVHLDEETGMVQGYEVAAPAYAGLVQRRAVLPRTGDITIGRDVVLVSDAAARAFERGREAGNRA